MKGFVVSEKGVILTVLQGAVLRTIVPLGAVILYAFFGAILFYFVDSKGPNDESKTATTEIRPSIAICHDSYRNISQTMAASFKASREFIVNNATENERDRLWVSVFNHAGNLTAKCEKELLENSFMTVLESIFFCWTVYTTIGYGVLSPATWAGKIFTIVYAVFGIPIMAYALLICGDQLFQLLWKIYLIFQRTVRVVLSFVDSTNFLLKY